MLDLELRSRAAVNSMADFKETCDMMEALPLASVKRSKFRRTVLAAKRRAFAMQKRQGVDDVDLNRVGALIAYRHVKRARAATGFKRRTATA